MRAELRRHPWRSDGLLTLALLVASGPQLAAGRADAPMRAGYVVVTTVLVTTILVRRRYPVAAFATAAAAERARQMAERARDLQEKRTRAVDESVSRLRRIERDLHDGAQVRLAALAMNLGEIRETLKPGDGHIRALVETAHANAKQTL